MTTISIEEAGAQLVELVDRLKPGEEIELTRENIPVARLVKQQVRRPARKFGLGKGKLTIVADDDEHLGHFRDYML